MSTITLNDGTAGAVLDSSGLYRYSLWREIDPRKSFRVLFVMLNPSTADHTNDDRTVKRCIQFADRLGGGTLEVVNLFAYRTTDKTRLKIVDDPIGPENDRYILESIGRSDLIVAAWGKYGTYLNRNAAVKKLLSGKTVYCLKKTKDGHPSHPLYLPSRSNIIPFLA